MASRKTSPAAAVAAALLAVVACSPGAPQSAGSIAEAPRPVPPTTVVSTVAPPQDPASVATALARIETAIRDRTTDPAVIAELGRSQQAAYATLVRNPEWQTTVLELVPPPLRSVVEANANAGRELRALAPPPKPQPPPWRIVAPAPADELLAEYRHAEAATGVGWEYLAAIHLVETRMGRIRGDSVAGARGPMQFIPSTWEIYGEGGDIESNHDAIQAAARLLKSNGAPANMARALYAYNPSNRYVRAVTAYAEVMRAEPRAYLAYHAWQVYYGDLLLPEGYGS